MKYLKQLGILTIVVSFLLTLAYCEKKPETLKDAYQGHFLIGTALNQWQIAGKDSASMVVVARHFNCITAENAMKWGPIHPKPSEYSFALADSFIAIGEALHQSVIGHVLVWHSQTPRWVFQDDAGNPADRETLLSRMKDHIDHVAGRYKGRILGWDVVNEAFEDDGSLRESPWKKIIGDAFIEKAFIYAHEADPNAELYYNDFNMWKEGKVDAVVRMVKDFQARGIPIHGIGMQGHWGHDYPLMDELTAALNQYSALGVHVMITEMDLNILPRPDSYTGADIQKSFQMMDKMNPWPAGLPDSMNTVFTNRYLELFKTFCAYDECITRVTLWGVQDGTSWLNFFPIPRRTAYPLLFDRECKAKPVVNLLIQNNCQ